MTQGYQIQANSSKAQIRLIGAIGWWENDSEDFTRQVDELLDAGVKDVDLYINSSGGDLFHGKEIQNQVMRFPGTKTGIAGALCASAASDLLQICDNRRMYKNGQLMIHNPVTGAWGDRRVIKSRLQMLDNEHELSIDRYTEANTAAKTREEITDLMDVETWMTAEQALEMGFIDQVIDKKDKESPAVDNSLRQFKKAPVAVLNLLSPADPEPPAVETHSIMKEQLTEVLGMAPSATDAQVQNRVAELMRENTQLKDERDQKIQNAAEEKAKSLVDNAITAKQIPGADRELWMKDAVENYDLVERTINRIPKPVQLSKQQGFIGPDATMAGVKGKKFSELQQDHPEVLEQLRASDRDQYNALFKAEFGFEPSLDR